MFSLTKQERPLFSGQLPVISCSELEWSSGSRSALRLMLCLELHCTAKLSNICLRDQRDKQTVRDDGWPTDKRREKTSMFPTQSQTMNIIMPGSVSELHTAWKCWYSIANKHGLIANNTEVWGTRQRSLLDSHGEGFGEGPKPFLVLILSHNHACDTFVYDQTCCGI